MKKSLLLMALVAGTSMAQSNYPITPVPFTEVNITPETFWGQRLDASREVTVPLAFSKCEETGRYHNFQIAAQHLAGANTDTIKIGGFPFDDTDVYKTIEGCSYLLHSYPSLKLSIVRSNGDTAIVSARSYMDSVINIMAAAQEPDGYLYTARTMNPEAPHEWAGTARWQKVEQLSHEFYNLGHMVEGAIAHYQATGKENFLNIAKKYADCICREIGPGANQQVRVPGHQIAEMALAKLYIVTGDKKYLNQAKFFLDKRGQTSRTDMYSQAHQPVTEQTEAVGHAVRAAYMYSGMADVAALTQDMSYVKAIDKIWENIVGQKLYITGGIGATSNGEAFGKNYELPNMTAYCETCAAIGNVYYNYRLFLLHGESKYIDVLERTLYNGLLAGVSLDGGKFFYPNPLESIGQHERQPWFGCACCPSNICRFIPSLPGYLYAIKDDNLYFNLYASNTTSLKIQGRLVEVEEVTDYPYDGYVKIFLRKARGNVNIKLRIPGWNRNQVVPSDLYAYSDGKKMSFSVRVNEKPVSTVIDKDGYVNLNQDWHADDKIEIFFDMEPRVVKANYKVDADLGRVAIERGPLVYCAEFADNQGFDVRNILLNQAPKFTISEKTILDKYNVKVVSTDAQVLLFNNRGELQSRSVQLNMIPYFAWAHRGQGSMTVWMPQELRAAVPVMPATLASKSTINASHKVSSISAINDRLVPKDENDRNLPYYHWFPKKGGMEYIEYTFPQATPIQSATVYWFDDAPWGGCRVPEEWRILYKAYDGTWRPVEGADQYTCKKGVANTVQFKTVITPAVRLEVFQPTDASCGLFEWEVK